MSCYKAVPDGCDFSTRFDTYIIGFCPDTDSWFVTNQRFFYYEYPDEFETADLAEEYFRSNVKKFLNIEKDIMKDFDLPIIFDSICLDKEDGGYERIYINKN